ncbi:MAG: glycosyltransferase family 4 protein [Allopontixanthobacter sediminis]
MKVLVLSSLAYSLVNFRGDLLKAMKAHGHQVIACAPDHDPATLEWLNASDVQFVQTPMDRTGTSPLADIPLLLEYYRLMRREKPDVILAYTQKPIVYGGLAARLARARSFYALMSGLGHVFSPHSGFPSPLRKAVSILYREALRRAKATFVFNRDDRVDMIGHGIVDGDQCVIQVPGSGVSLDRFAQRAVPAGRLNFLLVGRLMKNKGIMEFLEASRLVRAQGGDCSFTIVGRCETENPEGLGQSDCERLSGEFDVEFVPGTDDVRPYLRASSVFVLPSYYREGLPRTILEAMATGRAVITTDMPGCRDPITEGYNGFLVRPKDASSLAEAMMRFVKDPELAISMGRAARQVAVTDYDVNLVNRLLLNEMGLYSSSVGTVEELRQAGDVHGGRAREAKLSR